MGRKTAFLGLAVTLACAWAVGCSSPGSSDGAPATKAPKADPTFDDHGDPVGLHNYNKWTDKIGAGAQPEGDEAFRNLAALGYTTILSVDGAQPEVETAQKHGLEYVHLPIQYSGIDPFRRLEIVKAVEVADGPVYIHCHHGKHRSAGATAVALIAVEGWTNDAAVESMKKTGCDPKYKGLYALGAGYKAPSAAELAAVPGTFPSVCKPEGVSEVMVDVDHRWEFIDAAKAAGWKAPPKHPDVDPPHEARMLWEHYAEMARLPEAKTKGEKFLKLAAEGEAAAKALEAAIRAGDAKAADAAHARSKKACSSCHVDFRDNR